MHHKAHKLFYGLAIFVLLNALFVVQRPTSPPFKGELEGVVVSANCVTSPNPSLKGGEKSAVETFRQEITQQFAYAFIQTIGDQPWFDDLKLVWRGTGDFYGQSADSLIALLKPRKEEQDAVLVLKKVYVAFAKSNRSDRSGVVVGEVTNNDDNNDNNNNFMTEEPVYNLIPYE